MRQLLKHHLLFSLLLFSPFLTRFLQTKSLVDFPSLIFLLSFSPPFTMIHLRVENSSTVRQWTLLRSLVSPPLSASHHANAVARVHASLDGRLCRIIRGGCVCHEVEGRGEACTPLVSGVPRVPDIPCYPKRTAVIPQDLPRATRGRHEAARGVHAGCKTTRGHEGRRGGSGATVLGLTGGERINRIGSPRP